MSVTTLAPGVQHQVFERRGPDVSVNVARVGRNAAVDLRTVSSFDRIAGTGPLLERTSAMCARVECLAAVNGDFFREELPVGAVAARGEFLRSPNPKHHQLMITENGRLRSGGLDWVGRIVPTDLSELRLDAVNRDRGANDLVLYTPAFGRSTLTNPHGVEMVVRFVAPPAGRLPVGQTVVFKMVSYRHGSGDTTIPQRGAVLSAHGNAARALGRLWERVRSGDAGREALLRIETTPRVDTVIGGTPVLLRDGKVWFSDAPTAFVRSRNPRTIVGWNKRGETWLVTVDGRQEGHSSGFTLAEAAAFMQQLGATDAINLDGGGSSTFVVRGRVVNRPSDRAVIDDGRVSIAQIASDARAANIERPVANALVLVPRGATEPAPLAPPDLSGSVPQVRTLAGPVSSEVDPGSNPDAALPALIALPAPDPQGRGLPLAAAGLLNFTVVSIFIRTRASRSAA